MQYETFTGVSVDKYEAHGSVAKLLRDLPGLGDIASTRFRIFLLLKHSISQVESQIQDERK
jgi:hypothetical protein